MLPCKIIIIVTIREDIIGQEDIEIITPESSARIVVELTIELQTVKFVITVK